MSAPKDTGRPGGRPRPADGAGTPHRIVDPPTLAPPVGFAHAVVAAPGRTVHLGGQTAQGPDGAIVGPGLVEQFDLALANLLEALHAAGGTAGHLVSLTVYTTDTAGYRAGLKPLGAVYRRHLGRHYPAMALLGVTDLFDPDAKIELVGTAVVPGP
ncbi:enamine deaminase RidA (YjgF/YER057c/UK114 family) [Nocardiopsis mwathae]|uniref:Enamine deaminase RidA (YjgF/YER057c/UK114 family) n=1 Tax=Nocardiopsis mwathae TaxID=1472723 RepID=A0A7W9YHY5_9ACTN|nr:RidA family protein [Nocardiopsis mwathae]MBB6172290.1 enamine deaminase RidA (YjgF/YER057c/UK114 family) [Nocardiopsis mwathae]